jgi:ribonuclease P/MRP protein subunit RPP40
MVSGLQETEYSMRLKELGLATLEERRHRADMQMVHKIMHGESGLEPGKWFERAGDAVHATRSGADPLNIKNKTGRLEIRKNFFSVRVISDWNRTPAEIKQRAGAASFKAAYKHLRENPAHPV